MRHNDHIFGTNIRLAYDTSPQLIQFAYSLLCLMSKYGHFRAILESFWHVVGHPDVPNSVQTIDFPAPECGTFRVVAPLAHMITSGKCGRRTSVIQVGKFLHLIAHCR